MIVLSIFQVILIHFNDSIYSSLTVMMTISFLGGVRESKRGWILALIQSLIIIGGFWIIKLTKIHQPTAENVAEFTSYASLFTTFAGSFVGAMIKRL